MQFAYLVLAVLMATLGTTSVDAASPAVDDAPVEYTVDLSEARTQYVNMSMTLRAVKEAALVVTMPAWRPGRYTILDPVTTVSGMKARSGQGKPLACEKIDKGSWMISTDAASGDDAVVVEYRVYCNALGDRTRHVDDTHAFLDPSAVFVYCPDYREVPVRVRIQAPEGWRTSTGMDADPADPQVVVAADYDVLADSPLEIGLHDTVKFAVDGVPYEIAIWRGGNAPPGPGLDKEQIARDWEKIIKSHVAIFGSVPYQRYVFQLHVFPGGGGGTEHLNSTVIQTNPSVFAAKDSAKRLHNIVSHEHFHAYNVKQLRPAGLKPAPGGKYDFQGENYTDLLWVAEGTTSYYDDLCLVRAGLMKPDDYLKAIGNAIESIRSRPGAAVQSVAAASFDSWIHFGKSWPDAINTTVSFYDKGSQVSMLLDMELRKRSEGKASLDTWMKEMYLAFPLSGPGFTQEDAIRMAERLTVSSFRSFFDDYVQGVKPLDFEQGLSVVGVEVVHEPSKDEGGKHEDELAPRRAYIGLNLAAQEGLASVSGVLADGPAYKAGVLPGDLVVAMNGQRLRPGDLDGVLKRLRPGDTIKLTLLRFDQLKEIEFKADGRFDGSWVVKRVKNPTEAQKAAYASWLGQPWPDEKKTEDKKDEKKGARVTDGTTGGTGG